LQPSAVTVAQHYQGLIGGFVIDNVDAASAEQIYRLGMTVHTAQTVMRTHDDRVSLARDCLALAKTLAAKAH
jgi:LPPG:FO 2-phospho-L-lactate transferase